MSDRDAKYIHTSMLYILCTVDRLVPSTDIETIILSSRQTLQVRLGRLSHMRNYLRMRGEPACVHISTSFSKYPTRMKVTSFFLTLLVHA